MRTTKNDSNIANALFGQVRQAILTLLYTHSDQSYYVRQIARIAGGGLGAVHRELSNLVQAGLIVRTTQGKQVYYQVNRNSPVFTDLRGLIVRTTGVADIVKSSLAPLADRINVAFIYGSIARGSEKANSDIDVMVVGDVDFGEVVSALNPSQNQLGREINPSVFALDEFNEKIDRQEHFLTSVMRAPRIVLIGDESELRTVA